MRTACNVCPPSASVNTNEPGANVSAVSSLNVDDVLPPLGGVLAPTLILKVPLAVPPLLSEMVYVTFAVPLKLLAGVKLMVPSALRVTVP